MTSVAEQFGEVKSRLQDHYSEITKSGELPGLAEKITALSNTIIELTLSQPDAAKASIQFGTLHLNYSANHSVDTAIICICVGHKLNWSTERLREVSNAALTMNLGMLALQDDLFHHKTDLTEEQKKIVHDHCQSSMRILRKSGVTDNEWLNTVLCHHERIDGSGYPRKIKINDIPLTARVLNLADMMDALLSPRAYRSGIATNKAMHNLFHSASKFFDPEVSNAFIESFTYFPPGTIVITKNNKKAIIKHSAGDPRSPVLTIITKDSADQQNVTPADLGRIEPPVAEPPEFELSLIWDQDTSDIAHIGYAHYNPSRMVPPEHDLRNAQQALKGVTIPPMPAAILELQKETAKSDPSIDVIGRFVSEDVALAGQVLKLMKSPLLGLRAQITSINHAVMVLGLDKFGQMVLTSAVQNMMNTAGKKQENFVKESRLTAHCAEKLAKKVQDVDASSAYMAGLFASCGSLFLCQKYSEYASWYVSLAASAPYSLIHEEQEKYGTDHTVLGFLVAKTWQVPDAVCQAIYHHHSPDIANISDATVKLLVAVLAVATSLVSAQLYGEHNSPEAEHLLESAVNELLIDHDDLNEIKQDLIDEVELL